MFIPKSVKKVELRENLLVIEDKELNFGALTEDDKEVLNTMISKGSKYLPLLYLNSKYVLESINGKKLNKIEYLSYLLECKKIKKAGVKESNTKKRPLANIGNLEILEGDNNIYFGKEGKLFTEAYNVNVVGTDNYKFKGKTKYPYAVSVIYRNTGDIKNIKSFSTEKEARSWIEKQKANNAFHYDYQIDKYTNNSEAPDVVDFISESSNYEELRKYRMDNDDDLIIIRKNGEVIAKGMVDDLKDNWEDFEDFTFDEETKKYVCEYNGDTYTVEKIIVEAVNPDRAAIDDPALNAEEEEELNSLYDREIESYTCKNCGKKIPNILDWNKKHYKGYGTEYYCPYCGEPYTYKEVGNMATFKESWWKENGEKPVYTKDEYDHGKIDWEGSVKDAYSNVNIKGEYPTIDEIQEYLENIGVTHDNTAEEAIETNRAIKATLRKLNFKYLDESIETPNLKNIKESAEENFKDMVMELHSYVDANPKNISIGLKKAIQDNKLEDYLRQKAAMTDEEIEDFKSRYLKESEEVTNDSKQRFIDYCKDKIEDLESVSINSEDVEGITYNSDNENPKTYEIKVDYISEDGTKILNSVDTLEAFGLENTYLYPDGRVFDGGEMDAGHIAHLAELDFKAIDRSFYQEVLDNWEDWELPSWFEVADEHKDRNVNEAVEEHKVIEACPMCDKEYCMELTEEEYSKYQEYLKGSIKIQDAFPDMLPIEREFLKIGYCPECQELLFASDKNSNRIKEVINEGEGTQVGDIAPEEDYIKPMIEVKKKKKIVKEATEDEIKNAKAKILDSEDTGGNCLAFVGEIGDYCFVVGDDGPYSIAFYSKENGFKTWEDYEESWETRPQELVDPDFFPAIGKAIVDYSKTVKNPIYADRFEEIGKLFLDYKLEESLKESVNDLEIEYAEPNYTGGGIYVYTGKLKDGNYFMACDECFDNSTKSFRVRIVNENPDESDDDGNDAWFPEWQEARLVRDPSEAECRRFTKKLLKWVMDNKPDGNYDMRNMKDMYEVINPRGVKESVETYTDEEKSEYGLDEEGYDETGDKYIHCEWCSELVPVSECKKEMNLGWICDDCQKALYSRGEKAVYADGADYLEEAASVNGENDPKLDYFAKIYYNFPEDTDHRWTKKEIKDWVEDEIKLGNDMFSLDNDTLNMLYQFQHELYRDDKKESLGESSKEVIKETVWTDEDFPEDPNFKVDARDLALTNGGYHNNMSTIYGRVKLVPKNKDKGYTKTYDIIYFTENGDLLAFKPGYPVKDAIRLFYSDEAGTFGSWVKWQGKRIKYDDLDGILRDDAIQDLSNEEEEAILSGIYRAKYLEKPFALNRVNYQ